MQPRDKSPTKRNLFATEGKILNERSPKAMKVQPPISGAMATKPSEHTVFKLYYDRGDLFVSIDHRGATPRLKWKIAVEKIDYHHFLPIFFHGIRERDHPYQFIAREGTIYLLTMGRGKVLPVVPQLIIPIRAALDTRHPETVCTMLTILQLLVISDDLVGEALVPFYRQILPVLNLYSGSNIVTGDRIYYGQRKNQCLGDLVQQTLEVFEQNGGVDAYVNIKYMIPTYTSCMQ
eukprot:gnl/Chilomastix_caulleri/1022.p1 GENE.gnl/Chilomastix_caulleri/1022~~gnl/Chilomastix_caulleri/1022.p1  ORF type:complete len:243 (-),score=44.81 gnl/Chilomastix_caulleri/1022:88-789(-)